MLDEVPRNLKELVGVKRSLCQPLQNRILTHQFILEKICLDFIHKQTGVEKNLASVAPRPIF